MRCFTAILVLVASASPLAATPIIINFDDLADGDSVTTQYNGLTFTNTTVLTSGISLNEFEFPPYSGDNVVFDDGGPISITFGSPVSSFGAYFTYTEALTLTALDSSGGNLGFVSSLFSDNQACLDGPPCLGDPGSSPNEFIQISLSKPIAQISIQADPGGTSFTMDSLMYTNVSPSTQSAPEPSTFALVLSLPSAWVFVRLRCWMARKPQKQSS